VTSRVETIFLQDLNDAVVALLVLDQSHEDFRLLVTFFGIPNRIVEIPDPVNMQVAAGISLITCIPIAMCASGFGCAILDFLPAVTCAEIPNRTIELPDPENTGLAVRIVALCFIDRKILSGVPLLATYVYVKAV
jgi:hypothetical protein